MSLHVDEGTSVTAEPEASNMLAVNYVDQVMTHWCWAACAEMIFTFKGMDISKCDVVKRDLEILFGAANDTTLQNPCGQPSSDAALSSNIACMSNTPSYVYNCWFHLYCARQGPGLSTSGITNLIKNQIDLATPIHMQDSFHAVVITGYHVDGSGDITDLNINDPDSGTGVGVQDFNDPDYFDWPHTTFFYDFGNNSGFPC